MISPIPLQYAQLIRYTSQTSSAHKQNVVNKGHARYLAVVGDLEHELPIAVPVLRNIAGLHRHGGHKQIRLDRTPRTKREGIQRRREEIGVAAAYGAGVGAEELYGPLHELVPRIHVHHRCGGEGRRRAGAGAVWPVGCGGGVVGSGWSSPSCAFFSSSAWASLRTWN